MGAAVAKSDRRAPGQFTRLGPPLDLDGAGTVDSAHAPSRPSPPPSNCSQRPRTGRLFDSERGRPASKFLPPPTPLPPPLAAAPPASLPPDSDADDADPGAPGGQAVVVLPAPPPPSRSAAVALSVSIPCSEDAEAAGAEAAEEASMTPPRPAAPAAPRTLNDAAIAASIFFEQDERVYENRFGIDAQLAASIDWDDVPAEGERGGGGAAWGAPQSSASASPTRQPPPLTAQRQGSSELSAAMKTLGRTVSSELIWGKGGAGGAWGDPGGAAWGQSPPQAASSGPHVCAGHCNADKTRLHQRLWTAGLAEKNISGDGNCQFASISDQ